MQGWRWEGALQFNDLRNFQSTGFVPRQPSVLIPRGFGGDLKKKILLCTEGTVAACLIVLGRIERWERSVSGGARLQSFNARGPLLHLESS